MMNSHIFRVVFSGIPLSVYSKSMIIHHIIYTILSYVYVILHIFGEIYIIIFYVFIESSHVYEL